MTNLQKVPIFCYLHILEQPEFDLKEVKQKNTFVDKVSVKFLILHQNFIFLKVKTNEKLNKTNMNVNVKYKEDEDAYDSKKSNQ